MNWEVVARSWIANISNGKIPLGKVRLAILILLTIMIAYLLAILTQQLLPASHSKGQWQPPRAEHGGTPHQRDVSTLQDLKLFGESNGSGKAIAQQQSDAPKTKLKVKLTGVVASSEPEKGLAIIESKSVQATYGIDDRIENTRAVVKEIYPDRVIISNAGALETLQLDDSYAKSTYDDNRPAEKSSSRKRKTNKALRENKVREALKSVRASKSAEDKLAKLTDYVKITPVREGVELKGFRVNPGVDRELFQAVGLKANDLAVSLNGYDLTDITQSAQVMEELNTMTDLSLTVERDGQLYDFLLELPSP